MIEAPNSYHGPIDPRQSSAKKEENKVIEDICELQKGGIMCIYCNSTFVRSDYLTKHLRYCLNRQIHENKLNEKIKFLENKLTETVKVYELENKHHIEEKEHYKTEMINYKKLLMETGKLVKTSVNALTYVVDNYEDAPAIKQIKFNDLNTKKLGKVKFIEELLSAYKHKILNKFLGDSIIAIQDMGAAGLTSSSVEMAAKGNVGIELNLNLVPCRELNMTPYEMMLSESQERMLIVLNSGTKNKAKKIFDKWNLDFSIIGKTTDTKNIVLKFDKKVVAQIPIDLLSKNVPLYNRKWSKKKITSKKNIS